MAKEIRLSCAVKLTLVRQFFNPAVDFFIFLATLRDPNQAVLHRLDVAAAKWFLEGLMVKDFSRAKALLQVPSFSTRH